MELKDDIYNCVDLILDKKMKSSEIDNVPDIGDRN